MGTREERLAKNETTSREINEGIEDAHAETSPTQDVRMVCECGRESCDRVIAITLAEYEQVRSDPTRFAIVREHLIADVEELVDGTDRFAVVSKREGTPKEVAVEEDPRS